MAEREDGVGRVFASQREAAAAGELVAGDRIEHAIAPGGMAVDLLLDRRARVLAAVAEAAQ